MTASTTKPTLSNLADLLRSHDEWTGVLAYDKFAECYMLLQEPPCGLRDQPLPRPLIDRDVYPATQWIQQHGYPTASTSQVREALFFVSGDVRFHPPQDYLRSLAPWDGVARIETFLIDHAGAANTPLNRAMASKWLIQAVARIFQPGCQADAMLILEGEQGIYKSTMLRTLFDPWFTDHLPDLHEKDAKAQLLGMWCIELAELATLGRADTNRIKAFLSARVDRFRPSYERIAQNFPRTTVFVGTVNPGASTGYLKDPTGGRRFWPLEVNGIINIKAIAARRDQLWAEAKHRYEQGEPWYLDEPSLAAEAAEAQETRYETDPWEEKIGAYVGGKSWVTIPDVLSAAVVVDLPRQGQREQNRVASVLRHLGWKRAQKRVGGSRVWGYERSSL